ncbi:MAG: hypothetical protein IKK66_06775 [Ruminococcus sp.]|nr:hypothetical protein [Ruminococcus sp.]
MLNQKGKSIVRNIGTVFITAALILRLSSSHIGGAFAEFTEAAFPWLTIGVAVAVVLVYSSGREDKICEKQNTGIEKKP